MSNLENAKVAAEWVGKAENDLKNAVHTLKLDDDCPTDTICFHVQQCVEKYLKALLVLRGSDFPKTHNIANLLELLPPSVRPQITEDEQDTLSEYATVTRYPGEYEPISLTEARKAVALARRVRGYIRKLFPKEMLRQKK